MRLMCEYKICGGSLSKLKKAEVMSMRALLVGGYCCIIHLTPARTRACAPRVALPLRLGRGVCGLASRVLRECQLGVVRAGLVRSSGGAGIGVGMQSKTKRAETS
jgi:hypothetical protein